MDHHKEGDGTAPNMVLAQPFLFQHLFKTFLAVYPKLSKNIILYLDYTVRRVEFEYVYEDK